MPSHLPENALETVRTCLQRAWDKLTNGEQKLLLLLAGQLDQEVADASVCLVPMSDIEQTLEIPGAGEQVPFSQKLDNLLSGITNRRIVFPTGILVDGDRASGHIHWMASAVPAFDDSGKLCVAFGLSPMTFPFLLQLQENNARRDLLETAKLKGPHSAQLYRICLAHSNRQERRGNTPLAISLEELKQHLDLGDKYPDIRNFRRKVLAVAKAEINEHTRLHIDYDFVKQGRNVTGLRVIINRKDSEPEAGTHSKPTKKAKPLPVIAPVPASPQMQIEQLTEAQRRALNTITGFGLETRLALEAVLPLAKGSELAGYEDLFVNQLLAHFEKKARPKSQADRIATFMVWLESRRFSDPNTQAKLLEQVVARKKQLTDAERTNRERAKAIPAAKFRQLLEAERTPDPDKPVSPAQPDRRSNRVGEGDPPTGQIAKSARPPIFDFGDFKKQYSDIFQKIKKEREAAFEGLQSAPNHSMLLENSIRAYCEQWWKRNSPSQ